MGDGVIVSALLVEFAEVKGGMVKMEPSEDVLRCQLCGVLVDNWLCCLKEHLEDEHGLDYEEEARCQGEDVDVFVLSLFDGES